jgi:hypothetical protein
MKKIFVSLGLFVSLVAFSQKGIGTISPASSAALDVSSTTKGFLPPRLTYVQKTAISSPVAGLIVWCSDCGIDGQMQVFNGSIWVSFILDTSTETTNKLVSTTKAIPENSRRKISKEDGTK